MPGEVERLVMELDEQGCDVIFVEGQGSLVHPGFGAVTLGLMLGALPDAMILCHQPTRKTFRPNSDLDLPSLPMVVNQYENLMEFYKAPKIAGIALNTYESTPEEAAAYERDIEAQMGVPTVDPVRNSNEKLWNALEPLVKQKLGR